MGSVRIVILGIGLLLTIPNVNTFATCVEKFLDGETAETKHVVTVGERVTLRCDVTARDPAKDMVYWKFDDEVMSQDDLVINKYRSKFTATLEPNFNGGGKDIYTLSWIAELDDAGKYNCTCTTGGIQYPVWIKRPCNKREHVIRIAKKTSSVVLSYLTTNASYQLEEDESLDFKVGLDCNCTWPEDPRKFIGRWYRNCTDDPDPNCTKDSLSWQVAPVTEIQDSSITPIGCHTGKGAVTYRYRNVFGSFATVVFNCTAAKTGKTYNFYIDEGEKRKKPEEHDTIMSIRCKGCWQQCPSPGEYNGMLCTESKGKIEMKYNKTMQIMSIKPNNVCNTITVTYNDILHGSTYHDADKSRMAQFSNNCSRSCMQVFRCQNPGIYKLNSGKDTLYEIYCAEACPQSIRAVEISIIVSGVADGIASLIGIFLAIAIHWCKCQEPNNNNSLLQQREKYIFITCIALIIVESLVCIGDIALVIQMNTYCDGMSGMNYQIIHIGIGTGIVLTLAVVFMIVCSICLCMCIKRRTPCQEIEKVQGNNSLPASVSDITQITDLSTLPSDQRQPTTHQNTTADQGNTNLPSASGSVELNSHLADQDFEHDYENVPSPQIQPQDENIENFYTPLSTLQLEVKLCMKCLKNSVQVFFKPCRHAAVCTSCAISMLDKTSKPSRPAVCPECNKLVTNYQKI